MDAPPHSLPCREALPAAGPMLASAAVPRARFKHRAEVVDVPDEGSRGLLQSGDRFLSLEFFPMIGYPIIERPCSVGRSFGRPQREVQR